MKNTRNVIQTEVKSEGKSDQVVEVLYQKMGDRWFAFSLINDEVFVGSIEDHEIQRDVKSPIKKRSVGNS